MSYSALVLLQARPWRRWSKNRKVLYHNLLPETRSLCRVRCASLGHSCSELGITLRPGKHLSIHHLTRSVPSGVTKAGIGLGQVASPMQDTPFILSLMDLNIGLLKWKPTHFAVSQVQEFTFLFNYANYLHTKSITIPDGARPVPHLTKAPVSHQQPPLQTLLLVLTIVGFLCLSSSFVLVQSEAFSSHGLAEDRMSQRNTFPASHIWHINNSWSSADKQAPAFLNYILENIPPTHRITCVYLAVYIHWILDVSQCFRRFCSLCCVQVII